jgi:uridine kinase
MKEYKIHILGASGSGSTTLGKALSVRFGIPHFDSDDFYWMPTDPPFCVKRSISRRIALVEEKLGSNDSWIISGYAPHWGDMLLESWDLVIQMYEDRDMRISRLVPRGKKRYGSRIEPGGDMHRIHLNFIECASSYDGGGPGIGAHKLKRYGLWGRSVR